MEEKQLILAIRDINCSENRKQQIFSTLYGKFQPKVTGYVCHLLHRRPADTVVTDLVEQIFTKAFLKISSYKEEYCFWGWLAKISLNCVRDYFRLRKRKNSTYAEFKEESRVIRNLQDNISSDSSVICQQTTMQVRQFFASLPSKYRKVMVLRFFQDKSYEEISSQLNMNIGTVSTVILRCRATLKKHMNL